MEALGGEEVELLLIHDLDPRLVSGQFYASAAFYPQERIPGTHCTGGWVGPRAGLDTEAREKPFRLCRGSNLDRPVVQPVARYY
jgi:hypothetical protein